MLSSDNLYTNIVTYDLTVSKNKIKTAFDFAQTNHRGQMRGTGEEYITHPVAVAEILIKMKLDNSTVITALLHDVVEDSNVTLREIEKKFGKEISRLVDGVTKLTKIELN